MTTSTPLPTDEGLTDLHRCEERLQYRFEDRRLLREALTHASGADHRLTSNERLEFLGDAVLGAVVCDRLYRKYPHCLEGELTQIKSVVVSRKTCVELSRELEIHQFLVIGKGIGAQDQVPHSLLADVFESIVGAIYLDGGFQAARDFLLPLIEPVIDATSEGLAGANYKSQLQHLTQRLFQQTPTYQLIEERGPDHSKSFRICVIIEGKTFSEAWGNTKKSAEQSAAALALDQLYTTHPDLADPSKTIESVSKLAKEPNESAIPRDGKTQPE